MFLRSEKLKNVKVKPTVISLFSGCGGMDLGFRDGGWEIRVMVEWEKSACDTLRRNWTREGYNEKHPISKMFPKKGKYGCEPWHQEREPVIMQRDITKTTTEEILKAADLKIGEAGCVTGGFPCQGFSHARGTRMIDDPRNILYKECVRVVREALPKTFLFENVPGLVTMDNGKIIQRICEDLAGVGYNVTWYKLNAADYGVPQNRIRIFIFGQRRDAMVFPEKGNVQLHMGAIKGEIKHPDWFRQKYSYLFQPALI